MKGLGLRQTKAINMAFQCKLIWKLHTDRHNLWVSQMHVKYKCPDSFVNRRIKNSDSWAWKKII